MWIFTRYGFYSAACARKPNGAIDPDTIMIRARSLSHLRNLQSRFPALGTAEILTLEQRDYRWRLIAPKEVWAGIVAQLAQEQEWSNFKNETARYQGVQDSGYADALHEVWQVMREFQQTAAATTVKKHPR